MEWRRIGTQAGSEAVHLRRERYLRWLRFYYSDLVLVGIMTHVELYPGTISCYDNANPRLVPALINFEIYVVGWDLTSCIASLLDRSSMMNFCSVVSWSAQCFHMLLCH
jgi:hypothetical protein